MYAFIDAERAHHRVKVLCRVLKVPESSYFAWCQSGRSVRERADERRDAFDLLVREIWEESRRSYGAVRVHTELRNRGVRCAKRRVAESLKRSGIQGISGRERVRTTRRDSEASPAEDLLRRDFGAVRPNQKWYGDITYLRVGTSFWFLATVIDAATREVVGWSFADHMRAELVTDALDMAVRRRGKRRCRRVIFHSDHGSQYTSKLFAARCKQYRVTQSMGRTGTCYDNAAAESFFSILKREFFDRFVWDDPIVLEMELFSWIEGWYNTRRIHTSVGLKSPRERFLELSSR